MGITSQHSFSTLLDIDKLTPVIGQGFHFLGFSTLLDIDKLTLVFCSFEQIPVLVLCWILINLHNWYDSGKANVVLVLCWILINLHCRALKGFLTHCFSTLLDIDNVVMITVYFSVFKLLATCDLRQILL